MHTTKLLPGKFVWFELLSKDVKKAREFYGAALGWRVESYTTGSGSYEMIYAGQTSDSMIGGLKQTKGEREPSRWISYVSVEDVDAATMAAVANGGKVIAAPRDIPDVGRTAGITDPRWAELYLLHNLKGDPPDGDVPPGRFIWNELHTDEPVKALAFYDEVIGFTHRSKDMGSGGTYYIISKDGVDRGGVTSDLPTGTSPHWLPYVLVDKVDTAIARAKNAGGAIPMAPEDIPGVGRIGVLSDPAGAVLALIKPLPMEKQREWERREAHEAHETLQHR